MQMHKKRGEGTAALNMALAISLGAFGAHGLESLVTADQVDAYQTASFYHIVMGIVWWLAVRLKTDRWFVRLLILGMFLFSASIYVLVIGSVWGLSVKWLGPLTPLGGLCLISAWCRLAWVAWRQ